MADIKNRMLLSHLRGAPTAHIEHLSKGRVVHAGAGLSFWFRALSAVLSEVPVDDREVPLVCRGRTADFQDVSVQASVTFRIADPGVASRRVDFSIDPTTGLWRGRPLEQLGALLVETAQQHALDLLVGRPLSVALHDGVTAVRDRIAAGLAADPRLAETGIVVLGVRVIAIRPEPEVEQALQTPTREQIQQDADKATYERRALAVERERAIAENEMQNQIELARREEALVVQRGANARRQAEEAAAADRIDVEAQAVRELRIAEARADATRAMGEATGAAEAAKVAAYRDIEEATLLGLAVKELAANLPKIDSLVLTPDLLAPVLARLGGQR
jgi:regulator of protease activity HflC (stomatin/prohibitin superfamily)